VLPSSRASLTVTVEQQLFKAHRAPERRQAAVSGFVKAYGENGYFKSLKEFVHFYNTRDVLPHCPAGSSGQCVTRATG
jgi:cytochrome c peroxidase